jgi:tryptophan synthase alpha chain
MDNRIDRKFRQLRQQGSSGFMAYITGGDPTPDRTVDIAVALSAAGVDFLEIGIPFSDPLADGLANQLGAQRALAAGTTVQKLLKTIADIRRKLEFPIILYSYLNPLFQYGLEKFEYDAAMAGVDGLLLLDLPPDETLLTETKILHRIRLVAPTTSEERIKQIVSKASGFVYYVSREGVTGEQEKLSQTIEERVATIRRATDLPVAIGFGISNAAQARQVASMADAVVVGSAIVRRIGEFGNDEQLPNRIQEFVQPLVDAVKSV